MTSTSSAQDGPQAINEGDDATMTQPAPSERIEAHADTRTPAVGGDDTEPSGSGNAAAASSPSNQTTSQQQQQEQQEFFYVIRKNEYLEAPVLLLTFKDFNLYMENLQEASASSLSNTNSSTCPTIEHKQFDLLMDALEYMLGEKNISSQKEIRRSHINVPINNNPKLSRLTTKQQQTSNDNATHRSGSTLVSTQEAPTADTESDAPANVSTNTQDSNSALSQAVTATQSPVEATAAAAGTINDENNESTNTASTPAEQRSRSTMTTKKSQRKSIPAKKRQSNTPGTRRMDKFEHFFRLLLTYKSQFGGCDVPTENKHLAVGKYSGLGQWVRTTRRNIRKFEQDPKSVSTLITSEQVERLKDIGFVIEPTKGPKWHSRKWTNKQIVAKQRQQQQQQQEGDVSNEANKAGEQSFDGTDIPVPPELILGDWDDMFEQLSVYKKEFGHVNIPIKEDKYKQLRSWVVRQRKLFAKLKNGENAPLTASQIAKLSEVGVKMQIESYFTFDERAQQWRDYQLKHGKDPIIKRGDGLGDWISKTRKKYLAFHQGKKAKITQEQIDRLTNWGFKWPDPTAPPKKTWNREGIKTWDERLQELIDYKVEHGTTMVPQSFPKLGTWVHEQRKEYKKFLAGEKSSMTGEKLAKLTNIAFVFNVKAAKAAAANVAAAAGSSGADNSESHLRASSSNQAGENEHNARKRTQPQSRRMLSKAARVGGNVGGHLGTGIDSHHRDSSDEEDAGIHDDRGASLAIDHYHHQPPPPQPHQHQPQHLRMPGRNPPGLPYHNHPYGAPPTTAPWDFNPRGRI